MAIAVAVAGGGAVWLLYETAFAGKRTELTTTAKSHARLIESIARYDLERLKREHPDGVPDNHISPWEGALQKLIDAHLNHEGFGETGEVVLARREGASIHFIFRHRKGALDIPGPQPLDAGLAQPMRRAVAGESGVMTGLDWQGVEVLAAFEPVAVPEPNVGIVVKTDLTEIRAPFLLAALQAAAASVLVIAAGIGLFMRLGARLTSRLEESEERFRSIAQSAEDAIISACPEGAVETWNRGAEKIFGYRAEEILGESVARLMPERYRDAHREGMANAVQGRAGPFMGRTMELFGLKKDGEEFPLEITLSSWQSEDGAHFSAVLRDISVRKEAEEARNKSEERYRLLVETMNDGLCVLNSEGRITFVNDRFCEISGYAPEEVEGQPSSDLLVEDKSWRPLDHLVRARDGMEAQYDLRLKKKEGGEALVLVSPKALFEPGGGFIGSLATITDITNRAKAEKALQENEELMQVVLNASSDAIFLVDRNLTILQANEAMGLRFDRTPEEMRGLSALEIIPDDLRAHRKRLLQKAMDQGRPVQFEDVRDDMALTNRIFPIVNAEGEIDRAAIYSADITEKRSMESQAMKNARLATIGVLAAGVAHEINNPNQAIQSYLALLGKVWADARPILASYRENQEGGEAFILGGHTWSELDEDMPRWLSGVVDNSRRIAAIVDNLKNMARENPDVLDEEVSVSDALNDARFILAAPIRKKCYAFRLETDEEAPPVLGSRQQLGQVFINVILNALESLSDPGKRVTVASASDPQRNGVTVTVTDEGCGIPAEDLNRITAPFYSTKLDQGGTGLGLSISASIVKRHGGEVAFTSEPGRGTTVAIFLPAAAIKENEAAP